MASTEEIVTKASNNNETDDSLFLDDIAAVAVLRSACCRSHEILRPSELETSAAWRRRRSASPRDHVPLPATMPSHVTPPGGSACCSGHRLTPPPGTTTSRGFMSPAGGGFSDHHHGGLHSLQTSTRSICAAGVPRRRYNSLSGAISPDGYATPATGDSSFPLVPRLRLSRDPTQPSTGSLRALHHSTSSSRADEDDEELDNFPTSPGAAALAHGRPRSATCPETKSFQRRAKVRALNRPPTPTPGAVEPPMAPDCADIEETLEELLPTLLSTKCQLQNGGLTKTRAAEMNELIATNSHDEQLDVDDMELSAIAENGTNSD